MGLREQVKERKFKTATSVEQSLRLMKYLDPATADMYYLHGNEDELHVIHDLANLDEDDVLAWSLAALMAIFPSVQLNKFCDLYSVEHNQLRSHFTDDYKDSVDAAVEMMEWMHLKKVVA